MIWRRMQNCLPTPGSGRALQDIGGGTWGGSVFDTEMILKTLDAGKKALAEVRIRLDGLFRFLSSSGLFKNSISLNVARKRFYQLGK